MRKTLLSLLFVMVVAVAIVPAQRRRMGDPLPSTIAVLRRDGVLVPFAQFDGKRWTNEWPEPVAASEIPIDLAGVPRKWLKGADPAGPWTAWTIDGQTGPLDVVAPVAYEAHCLANVGLLTKYQSAERVPLPHVHPHPKDALAVLGDLRLGAIEVEAPESVLRKGLGESKDMRAWFATAEQKAADRLSGRAWKHPASATERQRLPISVDALYSVRLPDGGRVSYFEASRKYKWPAALDAGCDLVAQVQGWFVSAPSGQMAPHLVVGNLFDCEMRGAAFMLPLGRLTIDQKMHWVVQWSGWGYERYEVIEVAGKGARTVHATRGGGC